MTFEKIYFIIYLESKKEILFSLCIFLSPFLSSFQCEARVFNVLTSLAFSFNSKHKILTKRRNKNVIFNYWNCWRNYFRNVINGDVQKMNCKEPNEVRIRTVSVKITNEEFAALDKSEALIHS